jgi:hypothetical protein
MKTASVNWSRRTWGLAMKTSLWIIGIVLLLSGLVWMGQGSGYFPYPAESFMISEVQWVCYGGITAVIGLVLIALARRWGRTP